MKGLKVNMEMVNCALLVVVLVLVIVCCVRKNAHFSDDNNGFVYGDLGSTNSSWANDRQRRNAADLYFQQHNFYEENGINADNLVNELSTNETIKRKNIRTY